MEYAFFISPHGFGHASRCLAVMEALRDIDRKAFFHLFTTVPEWFFIPSLARGFRYHPLACDVGFVQADPFSIDFTATHEALAAQLPFRPEVIDAVASQLAGCSLAVSDIAPLGIHAAVEARIPSVLVENFTWDRIYEYFLPRAPFLDKWRSLLARSFSLADYRIQTEPLCFFQKGADLVVGPISRHPMVDRDQVREMLAVAEGRRIVLVSFGGFSWLLPDIEDAAARFQDIVFVVPAERELLLRRGNIIFLPRQSEISHVDIVRLADVLVCKAGYSTLAEGYCAGVPVAAVLREDYPETPALAAFVEREMGGICLPPASMQDGSWLGAIPQLLEQDRSPARESAAGEVARFLLDLV